MAAGDNPNARVEVSDYQPLVIGSRPKQSLPPQPAKVGVQGQIKKLGLGQINIQNSNVKPNNTKL